MTFFNEEASSQIQYLTFPLEMLGFSLAFIEIRYPHIAKKIAQLQFVSAKLFDDSDKLPDASTRKKLNQTLGTFIVLALCILFLILISGAWATGNITEVYPIENRYIESLLVLLLILTTTAVIFGISSKWVRGREVGTFGLILAGMSLLGESYQFIAQIVL